jgi:hypothetical protein
MAENERPFFSIEIKGRRFDFKSPDEIINWAQHERQQFAWLSGNYGNQFSSLRDRWINGFNDIIHGVQELRNEPNNTQRVQLLTNAFNALYSNPNVVLSDSPAAQIAIDAATKIGPGAAAGAYAFMMGFPCSIEFDTVRGMLHAISLRDGTSPKAIDLIANTIEGLNTRADAEFRRRDEAWSKVSQDAQRLLSESRAASQTKVDEISTKADAFLQNLNREGNAAIASIQATEAAYREQMTLQAPVDYWTTKASSHREALQKSRQRLVSFASIGSVFLIVALLTLPWIIGLAIGSQTADSTAIYLKFAAVGAVLTTVLFWIGRVLLRIYLSDRHLLTDAEERVAMIKTYLALSHEGSIETTERALVLAPIFRSAADGIVKEEGPDASLAGIIARAIDVKGGGR